MPIRRRIEARGCCRQSVTGFAEVTSDSPKSLISIETLRSHSRPRLPAWFRVEARTGSDYLDIKQTVDRLKLHTICEEGRCPNRWGVGMPAPPRF